MITKKGYVDHIIYTSERTGYTVLELICSDEEIVCVGSLGNVSPGETLEMTGEMVSHPMYGEQLKVTSFNPVMPDDPESLKRYLGSGAINGIGEKMAERIVKAFGEDTMRILEEEPERLAEIKGISERKAREIAVQFYEKRDARAAFLFLQDYGISNTLSAKIYEEYGNAIYSILKENPYRLAEDIRGIGFKSADEIACRAGIAVDSQYRVKSGILYTLMEAVGEGNMYLPADKLLQRASKLLELPVDGIRVELDNLAVERKIILKKDKSIAGENTAKEDDIPQVYSYSCYYAELNCAAMLHDLNLTIGEKLSESEKESIGGRITDLEKKLNLTFDDMQRKAVYDAATSGIFILSGGPGTGKTTTINAMIRYFDDEGMDIMLAAPTGRAAKRMTEATGYEAKTIHRMLEVSGAPEEDRSGTRFERNEDNPLEADVIIIDEMSMVDVFLFQALLKAVTPGTRLILVGDAFQLPSVGAGQVLKDLMESGAFKAVILETIHRQEGGSSIVTNAHAIKNGRYPVLDNKNSRDFFFMPRNDVNVIYKHMIQLITEKLPPYVSAKPCDIQVLTPMKKGALGAVTLNNILQRYINPPSDRKKETECGGVVFREGDKVMQIKNNYQLEWVITGKYNIPIETGTGIFNGDMGILCEINEYSRTATVEYDESKKVEYAFSQLEELELAYAVTIHKSQGSEYPAVILPILSGPKTLLNRNLLYTAVTRAKNCVTILGSEEILKEMVDNDHINSRYTGLKQRINEVCI